MRILIADDSTVSRAILRHALANLGHQTVEAVDGQDAWARFQRERFDIVITDWIMPGIDGLELCRLIRSEKRHLYTYLILLTVMDGQGGALEGFRAGADDYLTKPFDNDQLAARLTVAARILALQTDARERAATLDELNKQLAAEASERARAAWALEIANRRIGSQLERFRTLLWLHGLTSSLETERVIREVTRAASMLTGAPAASFWRVTPDGEALALIEVSDEVFLEGYPRRELRGDGGILSHVIGDRRAHRTADITEAGGLLDNPGWWAALDLTSALAVPVGGRAHLCGVLLLHGTTPFALAEEEELVLDAFLSHAAVAIHNADLYERESAARQRADDAVRARGAFIATVSHELRTPMNGILGLSELLLDTPLTPEQRENLEMIRRSGGALLLLLNDILDFSKLEAGRLELDPQTCDLEEVAGDVVGLHAQVARAKGLRLTLDVDPALPCLETDPNRLSQILSNLVNNALKFTTDGDVVLRARQEVDGTGTPVAMIAVEDTGIGIDEQGRSRLFLPFSQVDASTSRRYGGTGLGLAISRRLVELLGGRIDVQSEMGRGSAFTVTLPFVNDGTPAAAPPAWLAGRHVGVATAHVHTRAALEHTLTSLGARVSSMPALAHETIGPDMAALLVDPRCEGAATTLPLLRADGVPVALLLDVGETLDSHPLGSVATAAISLPVRRVGLLRVLEALVTRRSAAQQRPEHTSRRATRDPLRVLVAEDNKVNQRVTLGMLAALGCEATLVENGAEAVRAMSDETTSRFDLVLMDCDMPVLDGREASRQIRALESAAARVPIVALTASAFDDDRTLCLTAGMSDFLTKPLTLAALKAAIERWATPSRAA